MTIINGICYADWIDGITSSWAEVANDIEVAWLSDHFNFVSIFGLLYFVGDLESLTSFLEILSTEWDGPNAN